MRSLSLPPCAAYIAIVCCILAGEPTRAAEPAAGKLVIVSAVYGDLDNDKTADVTAKVAAMVKDNSLSVAATKENFGEPAPGPKKLKVGYTIEGIYRSKTVDEGETLDISTRLVIVKAVYGDLAGGKTDDVTEQLADLVRKNKLTTKADNETFGDPAEGVVKRLKVDYLFDGKRQTKTVGENETLAIGE
jgi:hypothetical protein